MNQVMGDGIMALFGAPLAHEDHAVRACYAALRMQESVKRYTEGVRRSYGIEVQIRVGLNSGEVVVRAIGSDLHMDYTAVGQTTHLAARMEQLATPGSIRLTADTLRLAEGYVEVKPLGPVPVKGLCVPVEVYEATGVGAVRSRLQAAAARGLTRFVGRDSELEQLRKALEQSRAGRGQLVATVGDPGVGKSRLFHEFTHSHRTQDWLILESGSVSYGKATSYLPVIDLLKVYFKVHDRETHREVREKVTGKLLTLDRALEPTLPALLALLDVPVEDTQWQTLDPSQRRRQTLDAVKGLLLRESQLQPLLVIFEDLHWIDSETQALLDSLVESLPTARLLLLVNYRPEYRHGWGSKTCYTQLRLDTLPPESAKEVLLALLGSDATVEPLRSLLIDRTGGNPLFLEESVRTLVETRTLMGERGAYQLVKPLATIDMPATVQAILASRIDRLEPEDKQLLQTASVIGKDVPFALLQAIAEVPEEALRRGLAHLQSAEFLYETSLFPDLEYTFKHALTHEVAYGTVLHERRRALHASIVPAVERIWSDRVAEHAERLSEHAVRGAVWDKALVYLQQAGAKAFGRSDNRSAVAFWETALSSLEHLPPSREVNDTGIELRIRLRNSLTQLGELTRCGEHLQEAERLAEALGDQRRLTQVTSLLANYFMNAGDIERALASGQRALALVAALDNIDTRIMVNVHIGMLAYATGDYRAGAARLAENVSSIPPTRHHDFFDLAVPPSILSRAFCAMCLCELGAFDEAIALGEEAVRLAERFDRTLDRVYGYRALAYAYVRKGNRDQAIPLLERGLELCRTGPFPLLLHGFGPPLAYLRALDGRVTDAAQLLEESARSTLGWGARMQSIWMGDASLLLGRLEDADGAARRALDVARRQRGQGSEAWAFRLLGDIASHRGRDDVEAAEEHYRQALALGQPLGMRPLVAHCHLGLGKLYRRTAKRQEAQEHLATATMMYREMDMLFWLEQAEAQMTALA